METRADKVRALLYAIGVHLACVAVLFVGLLWTRATPPISVAGSVIEAALVTSAPAAASRAQAPQPTPPAPRPAPQERAPPPQPEAEPRPQQAAQPPQSQPQAPVPDPDVVEREKAARLAQQQAEEKARQEERERQRQRQIELDAQQRREAEERERLSQMEQQRLQQLADIRRQREEAEQRRRRAEERLRQLEDLRESREPQVAQNAPPADRLGNQGSDDSLLGRYQLAIQRVVNDNWTRPDSARPGLRCTLRIVQIPGGEVIQASVTSPCNADDLIRRSIEAAVLKAQPLPYRGYESVFQRDIRFNFSYDG